MGCLLHGLDFNVRATSDGIIVEVAGELDMATAPLLEDALTSAPPRVNIIVDLTDLTFLDARGVNALVVAQQHLESQGGSLRIRNAAPLIEYVIETTGLGPLLR